MKAWLIYEEDTIEKNKWYINEYFKIGKELSIEFELLITKTLTIGIEQGTWFIKQNGEKLNLPEFAIVRTIYPMINQQFEYLKIPVFNNAKVARICNDKALTYQYIAQLKIPMADTIFVRNHEIEQTRKMLNQPYVIKSVDGHGGTQVYFAKPEEEFHIKTKLGHSDAVFQSYVKATKHQDLRVYVMGKKILASVLRTAKQGFKSNFSLGGSVNLYQLSKDERKIVERIIDLFDFGFVGIDFLIDENGKLLFNEIEDVVGARMLYQCMEIDLVKEYLQFILEKIKTRK